MEQGVIYRIKKGDGFVKAIDIEALKFFLDSKRFSNNLIDADPASLGEDYSRVVAFAALETIRELDLLVNEALGLNQVEDKPVTEEQVPPEPDSIKIGGKDDGVIKVGPDANKPVEEKPVAEPTEAPSDDEPKLVL